MQRRFHLQSLLGLFQKLSSGGVQALFCPVGGGSFVDSVFEGWGGGMSNLNCPEGQGIFYP